MTVVPTTIAGKGASAQTSGPRDEDALSLLFRKLAAQRASEEPSSGALQPPPPYTLLIQHFSLHSRLRRMAAEGGPSSLTSDDNAFHGRGSSKVGSTGDGGVEASVYRRAGLRTPFESARRDWEGPPEWVHAVAERLCREFESVVCVQTLSKRPPRWMLPVPEGSGPYDWRRKLRVVGAASDPFGWNGAFGATDCVDETDGNRSRTTAPSCSQPNLDCLEQLFEHLLSLTIPDRLQRSGCVPLVLQSLSPLLHRHGFRRTVRFLQRLAGSFCPLVVPVSLEALSPTQHGVLEGLSQGLLCLEGGDAVLLRRGVRERDNVVRETLDFEILRRTAASVADRSSSAAPQQSHSPCRIRINVVRTDNENDDDHGGPAQPMKDPATFLSGSVSRAPDAAPSGDEGVRAGRRAVALELALGDAPRTAAATTVSVAPLSAPTTNPPRIFVQEDDPEYHDYDEEDPDDDLDL